MTQGHVRVDADAEVDGDRLAAWWYRPSGPASDAPSACVVMANGFSLTRHDGLRTYAETLADGGAHVLVFDYRCFGDSGGRPRQRFRARAQLADWRAALAHARTLPGVDRDRIVPWGYSFGGGHVATLLTDGAVPGVAAALVVCPFLDGARRVLATRPALSAWILPRAARDLAGSHTLVPVTGPVGSHGAMSLPGEGDGFARALGEDSPWRNEVSPGVFLTVGAHRPHTRAGRIEVPLWVGLAERDVSVSRRAVRRLAEHAPRGELHTYDGDHFDVLVGDTARTIAADQVAFLRDRGLVG